LSRQRRLWKSLKRKRRRLPKSRRRCLRKQREGSRRCLFPSRLGRNMEYLGLNRSRPKKMRMTGRQRLKTAT
jgi:hypothetical protein